MSGFEKLVAERLRQNGAGEMATAPLASLYDAVGGAVTQLAFAARTKPAGKVACYFSAEYLLGRVIYQNLYNMGLLGRAAELLKAGGADISVFEQVEDDALGNGGLGRLAACFLESAATGGYRLDGYGIRYKYGLFKQSFEDGFQREAPDDWQRFGDPFSLRKEQEKVPVAFGDETVWAVPYDMPVIGYGGKTVNILRLWQAEAMQPVDFDSFNRQRYGAAFRRQNSAEAIHSFLYPNDDTDKGKILRLKQQYFFSSASVQSILRGFKAAHGTAFEKLPETVAIQLNDTHPAVAIPELLRLLVEGECCEFEEAFAIARGVFGYTNHTLMAEALEQWDVGLFAKTLPAVWPYVVLLNNRLRRRLRKKGVAAAAFEQYDLLRGGRVQMAPMAIYASHSVNGVAKLHTEIIKESALSQWYALYPQRFNNKTNGVTPRRWLALCNPQLAALLDEVAGPGWITDLERLEVLADKAGDAALQQAFGGIKAQKKRQLAQAVQAATGQMLDPDSVFDIQIKRLHEYKRQLLNAFAALDLYYRIKDGQADGLPPVTLLFGAKAAPGYRRAKGIIKYINEVARLIDADPQAKGRLKVLFVPNYNVSWAEKLVPAADISQQISTAGTEASGTGNMKLMMNGAVTLGTWDGANIEIFEKAGEENNYVFGARVEALRAMAESYDPAALCRQNPRLGRVVNSLVDGTLDDGGTGMFRELHTALLKGASWHRADHYYLLLDFEDYVNTRLRAFADTQNTAGFAQKCLANIAASGSFSSDGTIARYASDIWGIEPGDKA